ncbi:MAG: hypothetical protein GY800_01615 [Planctomycetes bacterium]|nr:hypothetical protein [Planctomycetota bacterium]
MDRCTTLEECHSFSRRNMVKSSCLNGTTGKPMSSLWFWMMCSRKLLMVMCQKFLFLMARLFLQFHLLQCHRQLSDD